MKEDQLQELLQESFPDHSEQDILDRANAWDIYADTIVNYIIEKDIILTESTDRDTVAM